MYSLSDRKVTAQFDGKTLAVLKKEISKSLKNDFSEKFYSTFQIGYQEKLKKRAQQINNNPHIVEPIYSLD
jgi:hypothetical protein